jgi:hypothetical protein
MRQARAASRTACGERPQTRHQTRAAISVRAEAPQQFARARAEAARRAAHKRSNAHPWPCPDDDSAKSAAGWK